MKNSFRTKGSMKIYRPEIVKPEKHSFKLLNDKVSLAYCENGVLKVYTNIKQAENKVIQLQSLGYNVYRRYQSPFFILLKNN